MADNEVKTGQQAGEAVKTVRKPLLAILGAKAGVEIEFINLEQDETTGGDMIVRLTLKEPIPKVIGRMIRDNVTGEQARLELTDVEMVSIGKDTLESIDKMENAGNEVFTWIEEGKSGKLKLPTPFKLDVSRGEEVWVSEGGFNKFAQNRRNERNSQRTSNLLKKANDRKTKEEFKNVDIDAAAGVKPTPVSD